jgi:hypothetical protein
MREYYARLFREVKRRVFAFWKAQIFVSLGAGALSAIATAIRQQSGIEIAVWCIGIAVGGYLLILGIYSAFAIIIAPVELDRQRATETHNLMEEHFGQINTRDSVIAQQSQAIAERDAALSAKHPHDEHRENQVKEALAKLDVQEQKFIGWLLDVGEATNYIVQTAGFRDVATSVLDKTNLVKFRPVKDGNGLWESDRIHHINPVYLDSLRNVLHPPSRPVTPPQV